MATCFSTASASGWSTGASRRATSPAVTEAMTRLQNASQRYFGRPDATHVELDPQATSLGGWTGSMNLNRNAGVHQVNAALWSVSPGFDSSDAGFTFASDRADVHAVYQYRNPKVTSPRAAGSLRPRSAHVELCPRAPGDGVHMFGNVELKNYWTVFANVGLFRTVQDDRGDARRAVDAAALFAQRVHRHRERRTQTVSVGGNLGSNHNDVGAWNRAWASTSATVRQLRSRSRPDPTSSAPTACPVRGRLRDPVVADTHGSRYVFSTLDQEEFSLQTRVNYVMSPKMSLQRHAAPGLGRALHGVQAVRPPAHLRLHPARPRTQPHL